jgi:hypothetical protein
MTKQRVSRERSLHFLSDICSQILIHVLSLILVNDRVKDGEQEKSGSAHAAEPLFSCRVEVSRAIECSKCLEDGFLSVCVKEVNLVAINVQANFVTRDNSGASMESGGDAVSASGKIDL